MTLEQLIFEEDCIVKAANDDPDGSPGDLSVTWPDGVVTLMIRKSDGTYRLDDEEA